MKRLLAWIKGFFTTPLPVREMTQDEAVKAINKLAGDNSMAVIIFDSRETADFFIAEMRQAHNYINSLRQSGIDPPADFTT